MRNHNGLTGHTASNAMLFLSAQEVKHFHAHRFLSSETAMVYGRLEGGDMADIHDKIGARVRALREAAGYSQAKLSEMSGVSSEFLSRLERGVKGVSLVTLHRIADALGMDMKDLFAIAESEANGRRRARARRIANLLEFVADDFAERIERAVEILAGK